MSLFQNEKIKYLIFDLDDTLFDTFSLLIEPASLESTKAMIEVGLNASVTEATLFRKNATATKQKLNICELLVKKFGVSENCSVQTVIDRGLQAFYNRKVIEDIYTFEDTKPTLESLGKIFKLILVTQGSPATQKIKVEKLGLKDFFLKIYYTDILKHENKHETFKKVLDEYRQLNGQLISPEQFVSIGNRIDNEIKWAKILGMKTIFMKHGEYMNLEPSCSDEIPDATVLRLSELTKFLGLK